MMCLAASEYNKLHKPKSFKLIIIVFLGFSKVTLKLSAHYSTRFRANRAKFNFHSPQNNQWKLTTLLIVFMMLAVYHGNERNGFIVFAIITIIILMIDISAYDQPSWEDETTNCMQEDLILIESICNIRWFSKKTSINFFFKKINLLEHLTLHEPDHKLFP